MATKRWTDFPFPPYSYVTGKFPHPLRDEGGHGCAGPSEPEAGPTNEDWQTCDMYLWGFDLFNAGYYWEAHEAWEGVWHAAGRTGVVANLQKSLIKLAAAGVKAREGRIIGIERHSRRSMELILAVQSHVLDVSQPFLGVNLPGLSQLGKQIGKNAADIARAAQDVAAHVLPDLQLHVTSNGS